MMDMNNVRVHMQQEEQTLFKKTVPKTTDCVFNLPTLAVQVCVHPLERPRVRQTLVCCLSSSFGGLTPCELHNLPLK